MLIVLGNEKPRYLYCRKMDTNCEQITLFSFPSNEKSFLYVRANELHMRYKLGFSVLVEVPQIN